tara:strand:- start:11684 stop:13567 length:1884 start_codon:yes stop_codon:yes gene_type:complete
MRKTKLSVIQNLLSLSALKRKLILVFSDFLILNFSLFLVIGDNFSFIQSKTNYFFIFCFSLIGTIIYLVNGQYKSLSRFVGSKEIYKLIIRNFFITLFIGFINYQFNMVDLNLKKLFLFWFIVNGSIGIFRLIARDVIINLSTKGDSKPKNSIIYGAGMAGVQLLSLLKLSKKEKIKYFVDDNPELWNREINGIRILSKRDLKNVLRREVIDQILLAIPSLKPSQKRFILNSLEDFKIPILQIPSLDDINSGNKKISSLNSVKIEDVLGRDEVSADKSLLDREFNNKTICVFGAAGSIGFEICKQLFKQNPKTLIIFDHSEIGLYNLMEYFGKIESDIKVIPILGSCLDAFLVNRILSQNNVEIVFHAAAYKHVPIVQLNPIQGIKNNIISTLIICKTAMKTSVEKVLLISTDKAVRPTNIMGASKRVAEIILQAYDFEASSKNISKTFSMVRFGNVLNSSGSVIPLFEKQIKEGGPLTVTDPKITRYFMTIKEATELVLQASSLAEGGEVFLLDMGSPVSILDLAKQMIKLNGQLLKDINNPNGDIEIVFTGLRPGEKLYEELLVDAHAEKTSHPLIYKANEKFIHLPVLLEKLDQLKKAIKKQDSKEIREILLFFVPEMKLSKKI